MPRPSVVVLVAVTLAPPGALLGQSRVSQLVDSARVQLAANHLDSAEALLRAALDTTAPAAPADRNNALVWDGIVQFLRGHEDLARAAFRQALALDPGLEVNGLDQLSPELAQLFQQEQQAAGRIHGFYASKDVDESPRRLSGPSVAYPRSLLRRHVQGFVQIAVIIDTTGHAEPASLEVLSTPDSGLIEPVKQMMVASRFSPGRLKRVAVRVMVQMAVDVRPPRFSATELVSSARSHLGANRPDSALAQLALALDTTLTHPTDGERVYALLVRGVAASRTGRDSAGRADLAEGLARYQTLSARGVDLAPLLRRLPGPVRLSGRGSVYRPAHNKGRTVRVVIRQPVTFVNY